MNKKYISVFKKQSYSILLIFFSILTFVLIYNSCTDEILYSKVLNSFSQNFDMTINNGDLSTNRPDVSLSLKVPETDIMNQKINFEMKLSEKPDCTDEKWEPYSPSKNWSLSVNPGRKEEQEISVYVQFREQRHPGVSYTYRTEELSQMKGTSKCLRASIVYDRSPPRNLELNPLVGKKTSDKIAKFGFKGEDHSSVSFECKLAHSRRPSSKPILTVRNKKTHGKANKKKIRKKASILRKTANTQSNPWDWHPCGSPTSKDGFETSGSVSYGDPTSPLLNAPLEDGDYIFSVRAKDSLGNISDPLHYEWNINSKLPSIQFSDSLCLAQNSKVNAYVDTIPIKIDLTDTNSKLFSIECKTGDTFKPCQCKINNSSKNCFQLYNSNLQTLELDVTDESFHKAPLKDSIEHPKAVIDAYSDTIYYKKHTIEVRATTKINDKSQDTLVGPLTCTWKILPQKTELLVDNQASQRKKKKADILFIVDHSGSMKEEAKALSGSFKGLVGSLSELEWQIAVASMERQTSPAAPYYFGNFLSIRSSRSPKCKMEEANGFTKASIPYPKPTNQYILSPSSPSTCPDSTYCSSSTLDLQNVFMRTMECPGFSAGNEYGIRAAYKILNQYESAKNKEESGTLSNEEKAYLQFFREDATFVNIFLTDEKYCDNYKSRCAESIVPTSTNPPSDLCDDFLKQQNSNLSLSDFPDDLIQKVRCLFGNDKKFLAYPIVPTIFKNEEHYVDLAIKTQGIDRDSQKSLDTLIRVDVNKYTVNTDGKTTPQADSNNPKTDTQGPYTQELQKISDHIVTITSETIQLGCSRPPRDEVPASNGQLRIPGPIYFFKPRDGTSFTEMTPHQPQTNSPSYTHTFAVTDHNDEQTTHYIKIQESWKTQNPLGNIGQQAIRVKFKPAVDPSTPSKDPILPLGTYRVEYLCDAPST